jgi:RNA polymerase sigma factor (sigma-70 family)
VANYRLESLSLLARQLGFAPADVRASQLASAESLVSELEPQKAYPLDYVVFRVTGYSPKAADAAELLAGAAVLHDLCLMIEEVSDGMDLRTAEQSEPILSIDDVTERFNVTSKTIQRWRKKGLVSRRFFFPDGKKRVGFLLSSIERFVSTHSDAVERGANFSQVTDKERDAILRHAERLAEKCRCCVREITRRLARRFDRSPLTILHTIRRHDQQNPAEAIFQRSAPEVKDTTRVRIIRGAKKRVPLTVLAERSRRSRSAVYRVLLDDRIERLARRKAKFHDDPIYHQADALDAVNAIVGSADAAIVSGEPVRIPKGLPPYLQDLYRTPLLTPQQERALFLKFNYHKMLFVQARRRFDPELARKRELDQLDAHWKDALAVKNRIVASNLRLVVSVARKHLQTGMNLMELISEGNITLMRAVESFDIHKGVRFSTYATFALMKGFARSVPAMRAKSRGTGLDAAMDVADRRVEVDADRIVARDQLAQLLRVLNENERRVLNMHYGLNVTNGSRGESSPATLESLGAEMGLSKHRVRQIEQTALAKLRAAAGVAAN